ncbi:DUF3592 domain-containing protein [Arenicella xantha]|uniref:Uncharacterized protein DUF3592 n=1 Tax=Arenicella xantha TaxID=644221 RepID=A0A395JJW1_9GAMM|nr:uncharacterized protein DUF3592 [Arenicella xantha]
MGGIFSFFLIGVIFFTSYCVWSCMNSYRASRWATVEGKVIKSADRLRLKKGGNADFRKLIEYQYAVNGKTYINSRIGYGLKGSSNYDEVSAILSRAQYNPAITIRYNPYYPEQSALIFGFHKGIKYLVIFISIWDGFFFIYSFTTWYSGKYDISYIGFLLKY